MDTEKEPRINNEATSNTKRYCTQLLPDGIIQIENAYIEDADNVGSFCVDGRYTKVFVLEKEFNDNKRTY